MSISVNNLMSRKLLLLAGGVVAMAVLDHRALLTSHMFTYDDKDDAMVCLCTALSFTPCYGTLLYFNDDCLSERTYYAPLAYTDHRGRKFGRHYRFYSNFYLNRGRERQRYAGYIAQVPMDTLTMPSVKA